MVDISSTVDALLSFVTIASDSSRLNTILVIHSEINKNNQLNPTNEIRVTIQNLILFNISTLGYYCQSHLTSYCDVCKMAWQPDGNYQVFQ
jgi:hypothetical protein